MARYEHHPHLQLRNQTYYFRLAVPKSLQNAFGRAEVKKSLQTSDYKTARRLCRFCSTYFEGLFVKVMTMNIERDELIKILKFDFEKRLNQSLCGFLDEQYDFMQVNTASDPSNKKTPEGIIRCAQEDLQKARQTKLINGHGYDRLEDARKAFEEQGYDVGEMDREVFELADLIAQADVEEKRIKLAYILSDYQGINIHHPHLKDCQNAYSNHAFGTSMTLSEAAEKFLAFQGNKEITEKHLADKRMILDRLKDMLGSSTKIGQMLKGVHGVKVEEMMYKIPKNYKTKYQDKGITLEQVIEDGGVETISKKTLGKYWIVWNEFFNWLVDRDYITKNPLDGLKFSSVKSSVDDRNAFTPDELEKIFNSPIYTGRKNESRMRWVEGDKVIKDGHFWMPLVALHTGMREAEILGLRAQDVKCEDGIYYFDVKPNDARGLKNTYSERKVPVHPDLIRMGLAEYIKSRKLKIQQDDLIFADGITIPEKQDICKNFSCDFSRYLKEVSVKNKLNGDKVFHSFRHNFEDALRKANIHPKNAKAISGRALNADNDSSMNYGSRPSMRELYDDLKKLDFDVDLSHLHTT